MKTNVTPHLFCGSANLDVTVPGFNSFVSRQRPESLVTLKHDSGVIFSRVPAAEFPIMTEEALHLMTGRVLAWVEAR